MLETAHELADISAKVILPHFRAPLQVDNKAGAGAYDPVTIADRQAEQAIRAHLSERWPDHGIVGEEFGNERTDADYCWIIDPIDGTRAFVMGLPLWGTLIGLTHRGVPLLGVMNQPYTGERFWSDGRDAHSSGPAGEARLGTRSCGRIEDAILLTTSPSMFSAQAEIDRFETLSAQTRMTRFGGDCYGYCMLAAGHVDLVVEAGLLSYDIAALVPIVEAAGGVVTTWDGGSPAQGGRIAASGDPALHEQVLAVLAARD